MRAFPDASGRPPAPQPPQRSARLGGNPGSWYDGLVVVTDFDSGSAKTVRLYPLNVGNTYEPSGRGVPHLADPANAGRILAGLQKDATQSGTQISVGGSVGVIRIP